MARECVFTYIEQIVVNVLNPSIKRAQGDNGGQFSMPLVKNFRVRHRVVPHYGGLSFISMAEELGYPIGVVPHHGGRWVTSIPMFVPA